MTRKELYKMVKENNYTLTKEETDSLGWAEYHWINNHSIDGIAKYTTEQYERACNKMIVNILELRNNLKEGI